MGPKMIKPNENNDLKFMENMGRGANPIQYFASNNQQIKDLPISEDASNEEEKLEYFTE